MVVVRRARSASEHQEGFGAAPCDLRGGSLTEPGAEPFPEAAVGPSWERLRARVDATNRVIVMSVAYEVAGALHRP